MSEPEGPLAADDPMRSAERGFFQRLLVAKNERFAQAKVAENLQYLVFSRDFMRREADKARDLAPAVQLRV